MAGSSRQIFNKGDKIMLTHDALKRDVARRIQRVQAMMTERGLGALIVVGKAAPGGLGAMRYISNARLWGGNGFVVLGSEDPDPWVQIWSPYQALWTQNETTTVAARVESPPDLVGRVAALAKGYAARGKRIGFVSSDSLLGMGDGRKLLEALEGFEVLEVTPAYDAIRQIKTPFELEALFQTGENLDAAFDVFREHAGVGVRYWDAAAAAEAYVKARGAFWGRAKVCLETTPYTVPPPIDRTMQKDDIITFELDYDSEWGYSSEMTALFSFQPLPDFAQQLLDGYLLAVENSSGVAKAGNTLGMASDANDRTLRDLGFPVVGKHTPDCHSIGMGSDGPSSIAAPDFVLETNMVLSFHPGTVLENSQGVILSDNFVVTPEGAVRLSPHHAARYHTLLDH